MNGIDEKNPVTKLDLQLDLGPEPDTRQSRSTCQEGGVPVSEGPGSDSAVSYPPKVVGDPPFDGVDLSR